VSVERVYFNKVSFHAQIVHLPTAPPFTN